MNERPDEPLGSVAHEAGELLNAVQEWLGRNLGGASGAGSNGANLGGVNLGGVNLGSASEHIATGAPECTWCPICQLIAIIRGDRPEVTEKFASAASAMMEALRVLLDATTTSAPRERPVERISFTQPKPS